MKEQKEKDKQKQTQPPQPQQKQPKQPQVSLKLLEGQRVVIQVTTNIIEGDLIAYNDGNFYLVNVEINDTKHKAWAQVAIVPYHRISYIHAKPTKVEPLPPES